MSRSEKSDPAKAMYANIQQPPPMSEIGNMADSWRDWKKSFDWYLTASGRETDSAREKCALFLHVIGKCGRDIYDELDFKSEECNNYDALCKKFQERCDPQKNVNFERHLFFECYQKSLEFEKYLATLKVKSKSCEFGELRESLILTQMIRGIKNSQLRERLLRRKDLKLEEAASWCRAAEAAGEQAVAVAAPEPAIEPRADIEPVNSGGARARYRAPLAPPAAPARVHQRQNTYRNMYQRRCNNCLYVHDNNRCPAFNVNCFKCNRRGHFAKCCKSGGYVRELCQPSEQDYSETEELVISGVEVNYIDANSWYETIYVNSVPVRFKLDSGADVCVMSMCSYLAAGFDKQSLSYNGTVLREVSKSILPVKGYFVAVLKHNEVIISQNIYVVDLNCNNLLSKNACVNLKLIMRISEISDFADQSNIFELYRPVFEGIGRLPGTHKLIIDETIPPVVRCARKVPIKLRPKLREELDRLLKLDIITPVDEPTDWVSNIVLVEKADGNIRLCLDPQHLNSAIKRSHFQLPTLDEVAANLSGAKYFSVLDASKSFYMVVLDDNSSKLCTFATPFGRFRFLRLPFGIASASEVFHNMMYKLFAREGIEVFIDDILIHGKTRRDHDARLRHVLQIAIQNGVRFNRDKCVFSATQVRFLGHIFNENGMRPDPDRVKSVRDMPSPKSRKELERFLGMSNYVSRFIPKYAALVEPLRELLKRDVTFEWFKAHEDAFNVIKKYIAEAPTLRYYDPNAPVTVSVDASACGLGACLLQHGRPVAFAARTLTSAETRWAQIEKEMLAIVFGCTKFHQFIYGHTRVIVETDHKPLEAIFKKPLNDIPVRLQRLLLRLQRYTLTLCYIPGRYMFVADTLSRANISEAEADDRKVEEKVSLHVNTLISNINFSKDKLSAIREATAQDLALCAVINHYKSGWPHTKSIVDSRAKPYWEIKHEIHVIQGVLFRSDRVIIPDTLRKEMLSRIHEGHLGIDKSKRRARDVMWWPGMSSDIERLVRRCNTCAERRAAQPREPLAPHPQSDRPWEVLAADIFQIKDKYYLLVVDYFSKFVEVLSLCDMRSATVVNQMKSIFARHGIPKKIISDNGLQFVSEEFKNFAKAWEFEQVTSSPYYPRSNGLAERNVRTVKNLLLKAQRDGTDPFLALLNFRNTPITGESYSPAQLLMSRRLNTRLPILDSLLEPKACSKFEVRTKRKINRCKTKEYYDRGTRPLKPLMTGEQVRIREPSSVNNGGRWVRAQVESPATEPRSYWVLTPDGRRYRRNRQHIVKAASTHTQVIPSKKSTQCNLDYYDDLEEGDVPIQSKTKSNTVAQSSEYHTRSGRLVRAPDRWHY